LKSHFEAGEKEGKREERKATEEKEENNPP